VDDTADEDALESSANSTEPPMANPARRRQWGREVAKTVVDFPNPPSRIAELITELALLPALRGSK